jgi:hypothetical protein
MEEYMQDVNENCFVSLRNLVDMDDGTKVALARMGVVAGYQIPETDEYFIKIPSSQGDTIYRGKNDSWIKISK